MQIVIERKKIDYVVLARYQKSPINIDITTCLNNSLRTVRNSVQYKQKGRKHKQSRKQQVMASSSETSTSLSHIAQFETDEEILLQEIENDLNK